MSSSSGSEIFIYASFHLASSRLFFIETSSLKYAPASFWQILFEFSSIWRQLSMFQWNFIEGV